MTDMDEHVGHSDEANEGGFDTDIELLGAKESRSPPKSVHSSRRRKSEGGTSTDGKRKELLAILRMREEAKQQLFLIKQVQAQLKEHPQISAMGSDFIWSVKDYNQKKG